MFQLLELVDARLDSYRMFEAISDLDLFHNVLNIPCWLSESEWLELITKQLREATCTENVQERRIRHGKRIS